VHASGLCPSDCQVVVQGIRAYFWVVFALQEAKRELPMGLLDFPS